MVNTYYTDDQNRILAARRLLLIIVIVAVLLFIGNIVWNYLSTGRLVVMTNTSGDYISVTRVLSGSGAKATDSIKKDGTGKLSLRLPAGEYTVSVSDRSSQVQELVTVSSRQTKQILLTPSRYTLLDPVSSRAASNLVASTSTLTYTDLSNDNLYGVDSNNHENLLDASHSFKHIAWADSSFGIAQDQATDGLFVIQDQSITPLSIPFAPPSNARFAVAPDKTIYLVAGSALYRGDTSGNFVKIYDLAGKSAGLLVAGDKAVAIFLSPQNSGTPTSKESGKTIVTIDRHTNAVHQAQGETYEAAWSPSGTYLVTTNSGETGVWNNTLKAVAKAPMANVTSPRWLDDNTLLYGTSDKLWSFSLKSHASQSIAQTTNETIVQVTPAKEAGYIYLLSENQNSSPVVYHLSRVGLRSQPVDKHLSGTLPVSLPYTIDECSLGYLNFTHLTIAVTGPASSQDDCIQKAASYLQDYQLDPSKLQVVFDGV